MAGDRPSTAELQKLREMMELVDEPEGKIENVLWAAALSRDRYQRFYEWYERQVQQIETRAAQFDWGYPSPAYDGGGPDRCREDDAVLQSDG